MHDLFSILFRQVNPWGESALHSTCIFYLLIGTRGGWASEIHTRGVLRVQREGGKIKNKKKEKEDSRMRRNRAARGGLAVILICMSNTHGVYRGVYSVGVAAKAT